MTNQWEDMTSGPASDSPPPARRVDRERLGAIILILALMYIFAMAVVAAFVSAHQGIRPANWAFYLLIKIVIWIKFWQGAIWAHFVVVLMFLLSAVAGIAFGVRWDDEVALGTGFVAGVFAILLAALPSVYRFTRIQRNQKTYLPYRR